MDFREPTETELEEIKKTYIRFSKRECREIAISYQLEDYRIGSIYDVSFILHKGNVFFIEYRESSQNGLPMELYFKDGDYYTFANGIFAQVFPIINIDPEFRQFDLFDFVSIPELGNAIYFTTIDIEHIPAPICTMLIYFDNVCTKPKTYIDANTYILGDKFITIYCARAADTYKIIVIDQEGHIIPYHTVPYISGTNPTLHETDTMKIVIKLDEEYRPSAQFITKNGLKTKPAGRRLVEEPEELEDS